MTAHMKTDFAPDDELSEELFRGFAMLGHEVGANNLETTNAIALFLEFLFSKESMFDIEPEIRLKLFDEFSQMVRHHIEIDQEKL